MTLTLERAVGRPSILAPTWRQDPYPLYAWLRENEPAYYDDTWGGWLLTRHSDVTAALRDPRLSLGGGMAALFGRIPEHHLDRFAVLRRHLALWMGSLDTDDHLRVRRSFQEGFRPAVLAGFRKEMEHVADELIAKLKVSGRFDLVNEFAHPYSAITMAKFIGAPDEDWPMFRGWAHVLNQFLGCGFFSDEVLDRTQNTVIEMTKYFDKLLLSRCASDSAVGLLTRINAEALTTEEILASCVVLLFGGYETTATLIGSCVSAVRRETDEWGEIADRPERVASAVEEAMRYEAPIQMVRRCAVTDVAFGGRTIRADDVVWLVLGAANRDPAAFDEPDRFLIGRPPNRQLAFGFGAHLCVGAALSRLETGAALAALSKALPSLSIVGEDLRWLRNPTSRSLASLTVAAG
jgi:pimeloyl-[acyl-carrier protein] synthase